MANILAREKKVAVITALAEGNSIRSTERMTGVNQNTIMSLNKRVGAACAAYMDEKLRGLPSRYIQVDEIWGFIGKKQRFASPAEQKAGLGDVWTFVGIDAETKLVPCYLVGKRDAYHATVFMEDLAKRVSNRIQLSSDGLSAYKDAVESGFGAEIDYGRIFKTYSVTNLAKGEHRYSPAEVVRAEKACVVGRPDFKNVSTSYVERQNLTMRMHSRRLTRLTNGFSKNLESFKAAMGLHFAYYNFVKIHRTLRCTPAMEAKVSDRVWSVNDLIGLSE